MTHIDHNQAELAALIEIGVCTRAHAKRALAHLTAHADEYADSGMGVSERVDLALDCTA